MNGEIQPSVPIVTLAGLTNLTNLLSELPLPTPKEPQGKKKSLLFHPRIADETRRVLSSSDPNLVSQMAHILRQTNVDHLVMKPGYDSNEIPSQLPELVNALIAQYPGALAGARGRGQHHTDFNQPGYPIPHSQYQQRIPNSQPINVSAESYQENIPAPVPSIPRTHQPVVPQNSYSQVPSSHTAPYHQATPPHHAASSSQAYSNYNMTPQHSQPEPVTLHQNIPQHNRYLSQQAPSQQSPPTAASQQYNVSQGHQSPAYASQDHKKHGISRDAVVSLQPLSVEDISRYIDTPSQSETRPAHTSVSTALPSKMPKVSEPVIKLTKLELGGSNEYQVAGAPDGLKIRIMKSVDGSSKKRRKSSGEEGDDLPKKKKKKHKNKEHRSLRRVISGVGDYDEEFSSVQLLTIIDSIIDSCSLEDLPSTTTAFADDTELPSASDVLISRLLLNELVNETGKLKASQATREIPIDRLSKLMLILQWNVRDGAKVIPMQDQSDDPDESMILRDIMMDRVQRSLESALAALTVMTSQDMPKVVYVEDLIELIADTVKYQLINTIYPDYDPVYDTKKDKDYSSDKKKRSRATGSKHKGVTLMYVKLCDILQNLTELVSTEPLTDTIILKVSALAVQPFFVENISELQLAAIALVTEVFSRYEKHRQLILDDMFLSLARLPTTKRNLRSYRLNHEEQIQMVTALVLQLIQCIVKLPKKSDDEMDEEEDDAAQDVIIATSYEQAMKTAHHFLSVFLKKCGQKGEEDYRPLFDNFVNDLLVTANKPEWPASELMLSLLGRLLVQQFSNKQVEMSLRVASLDYLGTVAARLRKDAVCTQQTEIDQILGDILSDDDSSDSGERSNELEASEKLQAALLDYLLVNGQKDSALVNARNFYIAQWYRDIVVTCEKMADKQSRIDPNEVDEMEDITASLNAAECKKKRLMQQAMLVIRGFRQNTKLSYSSAGDVTKFLTSQRPFAQSFDLYLAQILKVLSETAVAVRTKAIKCLTLVIEADPSVLARQDMQKAVHGRLLDQSTSVREACVELIGKFILSRPDLTNQYYSMLSDRILDTGISVRKRVIKIFRDICVEMPNFDRIPDMCVKMIRRVNDEDGIKKLVSEVFQSMWFTPVRDKDSDRLMRKVLNITSVISAIQDANYDFMEQLLKHLLQKEEEANNKPVEQSCKQIVDCLIMNVLKLEEKAVELSAGKSMTSRDLLASLTTLHLFGKVRPDLLVPHADTLQPYLAIKCSNPADSLVLHHTARILELVIPLMKNPRESFLVQVEEALMTLTLSQGMTVLQSAVSCLGSVVNKVTKNYALVRDCFKKFENIVFNCHREHQKNPDNPALKNRKAALKRSLFTIGVLCRHFDFDSDAMGLTSQASKSVEDLIFEQLMYFLWHEDESIRQQALTALGFFCIRYHEKMMNSRVKDLYHKLLLGKDVAMEMRVQVLNNIGKYLQEEEDRQIRADEEWKKHAKEENLKEMGDIQSGMASTIVQVFLKEVLESYFNSRMQVRIAAVNVLHLILKQGLIHPVQCVPYLIAMSTDCDSQVTLKADHHLVEIDKKYPGFIHMKAMAGMRMSYRLQRLLQQDVYQPLRGIRDDENPQALNQHLYSIIRTNRTHRRALLTNVLNLFDDTSKTLLGELLYLADNVAFFPYQAADEPLFVINNIDIIVSVAGSNILQAFREGLLTQNGQQYIPPQEVETPQVDPVTGEVTMVKTVTNTGNKLDDDEDDNLDSLLKRLPPNCTTLQELVITAQGCTLLLQVKQHLKEMYAITDSKLAKYSPNEPQKVWERPISRKVSHQFNPVQALELLRLGSPEIDELDSAGKVKLIQDYLQFKALMMLVDPNEDEDEEDKKGNTSPNANQDQDMNDPDADPQLEITSYGIDEADAIAASMQPTISLMPLGEIPPEYLAQLHAGPSTSGAHQMSSGVPQANKWDDDESSDDE